MINRIASLKYKESVGDTDVGRNDYEKLLRASFISSGNNLSDFSETIHAKKLMQPLEW